MTTDTPASEHTWNDVRDCWENGGALRECADLLGVSHEAVRKHANAEGWQRDGVDAEETADERRARTAAAVDAARLKWANRRSDEADAAGVSASVARGRVIEAMDARNDKLIRACAIAYGIFIDKAQLLSGGATSRADDAAVEARAVRLMQMRDELAPRRDAKVS